MNTRQLLLGLSILVPAVCCAKPHSPFTNETIDVPIEICELNKLKATFIYGGNNRNLSPADEICSSLEYQDEHGLLFVRVDTLEGTFFGFALPKGLYNYRNELPEAFEDLRKKINRQYSGTLRIKTLGSVRKQPEKLNW